MEENAAFIRAIIENPDDDTVRLVYADWLDEHGNTERAEFIRIQIEMARSPNHPNRENLQSREAELLSKYEQIWAPNNRLHLFFKWRRGFVWRIDPGKRGVWNGEGVWFKILDEFPLAEHLIIGFCMSDTEFRYIPEMPNLKTLNLCGNVRLTNESFRIIGRWKHLIGLDLTCDGVGDECLTYFSALSNLQRLCLHAYPPERITDAGMIHLSGFINLVELDLSHTEITSYGLMVLSALPHLKRLNVIDTQYHVTGLHMLDGFQSLEELWIGHGGMYGPLENSEIAFFQNLPSLRILHINCNFIEDHDLAAMRVRLPDVELRCEEIGEQSQAFKNRGAFHSVDSD